METKPVMPLAMDVDSSPAQRQAVARPVARMPEPPAEPDQADLRLVIEEDANGAFVYKTIDRRTGEVMVQLPREQLLRRREEVDYQAGEVIRTQI